MAAVTREARKLDYPEERRAEVSSILREQNVALGWGRNSVNLERLENGAGRCPFFRAAGGLFTGPAYSVLRRLRPFNRRRVDARGIRRYRFFGWPRRTTISMKFGIHLVDRGKLVRFEWATRKRGHSRPNPAWGTVRATAQEAAELLVNQGAICWRSIW